MTSLQKMQNTLGLQMFILLCIGSSVLARNLADDYDLRRSLFSYGYKRYPQYDFGLGKRSLEEPASYEDTGYQYPLDMYNYNYGSGLDKRPSPGNMYSFGLGKRNQKVYSFGLGKRLEPWKGLAAPSSAIFPSYRQERRSKIYSFGLGKRQSMDMLDDDYELPTAANSVTSDKRSGQTRQFSFGLGKRDTEGSDRVKSTS